MEAQDNQERLLGEYRQAVCAMLDSEKFSRIENSSPKHAAIIIEEMIGHAERSFCAIAQRMNPVVWSSSVIAALTKAVKEGIAVSLLVVTTEALTHLDGIDPDLRKCIRRVADAHEIGINLAVMDTKAVRLEYDVTHDKAVFCVNETELANLARTKFDALYESGHAI